MEALPNINLVKVNLYDIKDNYVSYKVASLLKEKKFDDPCNAYYSIVKEKFNLVLDGYAKNSTVGASIIMAPTISEVLAWFRKEDIHITIEFIDGEYLAHFSYLNKLYEYEDEWPSISNTDYNYVANKIIEYVLNL